MRGGAELSPRLREVVDALPLRSGLRVLEIGCGPGAAAREVARRVGPAGSVLGIDRSARAIEQARRAAPANERDAGVLEFRCVAAEDFALEPGEVPFELAFAVRVGALDGRHPKLYDAVVARLRGALTDDAPVLIDGGSPLRPLSLD